MPYTEPPHWEHGQDASDLIPRLNILVGNLVYFATEHAGVLGSTCAGGYVFANVERRPSFTFRRMHRWLIYRCEDEDDPTTISLMREDPNSSPYSESLDAVEGEIKYFDLENIEWLPTGAVYTIRNALFAFEVDMETLIDA